MDSNRQMLTESARRKWSPILEHKALPAITDNYKKTVTTNPTPNAISPVHVYKY